MPVLKILSNSLKWCSTLMIHRTPTIVPQQSARSRHRAEVSDDVWSAFTVIGQGGPILKPEPPSTQNRWVNPSA